MYLKYFMNLFLKQQVRIKVAREKRETVVSRSPTLSC